MSWILVLGYTIETIELGSLDSHIHCYCCVEIGVAIHEFDLSLFAQRIKPNSTQLRWCDVQNQTVDKFTLLENIFTSFGKNSYLDILNKVLVTKCGIAQLGTSQEKR